MEKVVHLPSGLEASDLSVGHEPAVGGRETAHPTKRSRGDKDPSLDAKLVRKLQEMHLTDFDEHLSNLLKSEDGMVIPLMNHFLQHPHNIFSVKRMIQYLITASC